jgi:uncharacterized protein YbjT (DUF2867 family)
MSRSILVLGATGLVGRECLRLLAQRDDYDRVVALARRPPDSDSESSRVEWHVVDFDRLTRQAALFEVDQILCALGTTMKQAGSRERFRSIDLLYPLTAAHLGLEKGARHFLLVSAMSANPRSPFFYSSIKGELELQLKLLPYRSLTIARPSILIGQRAQPRAGERLAAFFSLAAPRRFRAVKATDVAAAVVSAAAADERGVRMIPSADLAGVASSVSPLAATNPAIAVTS